MGMGDGREKGVELLRGGSIELGLRSAIRRYERIPKQGESLG